MVGFKNRILCFLEQIGASTCLLLLCVSLSGCKKDEIKPYALEDCAVVFEGVTNSFSMKGHNDEQTVEFRIPVKVVGPHADYDRPIGLEVTDSTAVLGRDFEIKSAVIPAGALKTDIIISVNQLPEDVTERAVRFNLVPNDHFRAGYPKYSKAVVSWSELYARPPYYVWRYWYLYICPAYSQAFHKLMVDEFGTDVEKYTLQRAREKEEPDRYIFKTLTWWYAAARHLYETVAAYDAAHPDAPMMHSDDYEEYKSYEVAVGEGVRPEVIPTILSTLTVL